MVDMSKNLEMHPQGWGDPAAATALPESARGLIELAFGVEETRAVADVELPASGLDPALLEGFAHLDRCRPRAE